MAEPGLPAPAHPAAGSTRPAPRELTSNGNSPAATPPQPAPPTVVAKGMTVGPQGNPNGALGCNPGTQEIAGCIDVPPSGGGSQFPASSGMATPGKLYSSKTYFNGSGWKFNPANGLWQNLNDLSQTLIPSVMICCDDSGFFPGDAINPPPDEVAKASGNPSADCPQLLAYMAKVASRTHQYPQTLARVIRIRGGCKVPGELRCKLAKSLGGRIPPGCPPGDVADSGDGNSANNEDDGPDNAGKTPDEFALEKAACIDPTTSLEGNAELFSQEDAATRPTAICYTRLNHDDSQCYRETRFADRKTLPNEPELVAALYCKNAYERPAESSPPPPADKNEAYCLYMARDVVRGGGGVSSIPRECEATIAAAKALNERRRKDGVSPFSMSDVETDAEIRRLLQQTQPNP
jgi:hypothetical protein